jgi:signal transduction histidine kinase
VTKHGDGTGEWRSGKIDPISMQRHYLHYILVIFAVLILIGLGVYFVIQHNEVFRTTAKLSYQQTEMEIVREAARGIEEYVYVQTVVLGRTDIDTIEQEIFKKFVAPIHLLKNGDAWVYARDHVVFDKSADFPEIYQGRSMAQIFEIQKSLGASHYEDMVADVSAGKEGVGYYIWLPEKGEEIAAWTPVRVQNNTWMIGLATPLPEILEATGATAQSAKSTMVLIITVIIALMLLSGWLYSDYKRLMAERSLRIANAKLNLLSSITRHDIRNQVTGQLMLVDLAKEQNTDPDISKFLDKIQLTAESISRKIEFTSAYEDMGVKSPEWFDVEKLIHDALADIDLNGIRIILDIGSCSIYADPLISKVFYNLIENALRYGKTLTSISFKTERHFNTLVIICEDDGAGIAPEDKNRLFERGFGKSTGLGLFLSREILAITDITITENSGKGQGARFELHVPSGKYRYRN